MKTQSLFWSIAALMLCIVLIGAYALLRQPHKAADMAREAELAVTRTVQTAAEVAGVSDGSVPPLSQGASAKTYTLADVSLHAAADDCWTAIDGSVYDLTPFLQRHPGGVGNITQICGIDGTELFTAQHGGESRPERELASLKIGALAQ